MKEAVTAVQALGPHTVLTTSLVTDDTPEDAVDLLASAGGATSGSGRRGSAWR